MCYFSAFFLCSLIGVVSCMRPVSVGHEVIPTNAQARQTVDVYSAAAVNEPLQPLPVNEALLRGGEDEFPVCPEVEESSGDLRNLVLDPMCAQFYATTYRLRVVVRMGEDEQPYLEGPYLGEVRLKLRSTTKTAIRAWRPLSSRVRCYEPREADPREVREYGGRSAVVDCQLLRQDESFGGAVEKVDIVPSD